MFEVWQMMSDVETPSCVTSLDWGKQGLSERREPRPLAGIDFSSFTISCIHIRNFVLRQRRGKRFSFGNLFGAFFVLFWKLWNIKNILRPLTRHGERIWYSFYDLADPDYHPKGMRIFPQINSQLIIGSSFSFGDFPFHKIIFEGFFSRSFFKYSKSIDFIDLFLHEGVTCYVEIWFSRWCSC